MYSSNHGFSLRSVPDDGFLFRVLIMRHVAEGPSVKDPVCGMDVAPGHAASDYPHTESTFPRSRIILERP